MRRAGSQWSKGYFLNRTRQAILAGNGAVAKADRAYTFGKVGVKECKIESSPVRR